MASSFPFTPVSCPPPFFGIAQGCSGRKSSSEPHAAVLEQPLHVLHRLDARQLPGIISTGKDGVALRVGLLRDRVRQRVLGSGKKGVTSMVKSPPTRVLSDMPDHPGLVLRDQRVEALALRLGSGTRGSRLRQLAVFEAVPQSPKVDLEELARARRRTAGPPC
jgi:hypothetical protein